MAHHGEGKAGGDLQEDSLRVSDTVPQGWRVHIWSRHHEERQEGEVAMRLSNSVYLQASCVEATRDPGTVSMETGTVR